MVSCDAVLGTQPRSGAIYVAQGVSLGNPNRITASRGAATSIGRVLRSIDVDAPRLFRRGGNSQRLRIGLRRLRRSAAPLAAGSPHPPRLEAAAPLHSSFFRRPPGGANWASKPRRNGSTRGCV